MVDCLGPAKTLLKMLIDAVAFPMGTNLLNIHVQIQELVVCAR